MELRVGEADSRGRKVSPSPLGALCRTHCVSNCSPPSKAFSVGVTLPAPTRCTSTLQIRCLKDARCAGHFCSLSCFGRHKRVKQDSTLHSGETPFCVATPFALSLGGTPKFHVAAMSCSAENGATLVQLPSVATRCLVLPALLPLPTSRRCSPFEFVCLVKLLLELCWRDKHRILACVCDGVWRQLAAVPSKDRTKQGSRALGEQSGRFSIGYRVLEEKEGDGSVSTDPRVPSSPVTALPELFQDCRIIGAMHASSWRRHRHLELTGQTSEVARG